MRLRVLKEVRRGYLLWLTIHASIHDREGSCEQRNPDPYLTPPSSSYNPNRTNISQSEETQKIAAKLIIWVFKIST